MSTYIDVTELHDCAELLAGSRAELGENAGAITWRNALRKAEELQPITDANREDARAHVEGFGAWERDEIDGWCDVELGALILQLAAGDIREAERCDAMEADAYRAECDRGRLSGRLDIDDLGMTIHYQLDA